MDSLSGTLCARSLFVSERCGILRPSRTADRDLESLSLEEINVTLEIIQRADSIFYENAVETKLTTLLQT